MGPDRTSLLLKILRRSEYCQPFGISIKGLLRWIEINSDGCPAPAGHLNSQTLTFSFFLFWFRFEPEACQGNEKCFLDNQGVWDGWKFLDMRSRDAPQEYVFIKVIQSNLFRIIILNCEVGRNRKPLGAKLFREEDMTEIPPKNLCFIDPTKQKHPAKDVGRLF